MKIVELFANKEFDVNANARIYAGGKWKENGKLVGSFYCGTFENNIEALDAVILGSNITYITIDDSGCIIVECDMKVEKPEITKMLTISTGHVTEETMEALSLESMVNKFGLPVYCKTTGDNGENYGVFIYLLPDHIDWNKIPGDLAPVMMFAIENNCGVLCLDRDGKELENFPTYEW